MKKSPKIDTKIQISDSTKKPRFENILESKIPVWQFHAMDFNGPFSWHPEEKIPTSTLLEIHNKLSQFESMTWHEIEGGKHHFSAVSSLSKEAKNRLTFLKQDDIDELFSLRLTGTQRVWGIRVGPVFKILWWDPKHLVYPSTKKHT